MEINRSNFQPMLKSLLENISRAHFIALDFEFSGIHKQAHRATKTPSSGKQVLQERYLETKAAAETYQILQVGITCVFEDIEKGSYEVRPFNFNLSPLMAERGLELDRDITLQGSAVEFLLQNSFQIGVPFQEGVPYFSRQEEALVRDRAIKRMDKSKIADIEIKSTDADALAFVRSLGEKIRAWKALPEDGRDDFLNISNKSNPSSNQASAGLNAFQRRLVYQTLRADFPDLVAVSKPTFMQIRYLDATAEASFQTAQLASTSEKITRQTGLRWLFEAMACGSLSPIDPVTLAARNISNESVFIDPVAETASFKALKEVLQTRRTVLVGHNPFTDLIYMYSTFFGALPDTFSAFAAEIRNLFPLVIDTKYLATADRNNGGEKGTHKNPHNWASSLAELDEALREQEKPLIVTHLDHSKYDMEASLHEAGYDSYLTAKILIRLSANLNKQQQVEKDNEKGNENRDSLRTTNSSESEEGGVDLSSNAGKTSTVISENKRQSIRERGTMMPSFDTRFWEIYGNRVRVFGTQEGMMDLNEPF